VSVPDGIEERLRKLELGYTEIKSQVVVIAGDVKDIKETLKELAEIAKAQIRIDAKFQNLLTERDALLARIDKLESDIIQLKKIAYGAMALAAVGTPVAIELFKHFVLK
jgi:uncharacterized protein YoxC